jgi:hypothetical protein
MTKNSELTRRREFTCRNAAVRVLVSWLCRRSCLVLISGRQMVLYESPHSFHRPYLSLHLSWTVENGHTPAPRIRCVIRRLIRALEHKCQVDRQTGVTYITLYLDILGNLSTTPIQLRLVHLNRWRDRKQQGVGPQECTSILVLGERSH